MFHSQQLLPYLARLSVSLQPPQIRIMTLPSFHPVWVLWITRYSYLWSLNNTTVLSALRTWAHSFFSVIYCSAYKVASLGLSSKLNLHSLLVNRVAWGRWKTLVHGLPPASSMFIISGYPHPALSQLRVTSVLASICWERACNHFSTHQRRVGNFHLKHAAGEGNQRRGACRLQASFEIVLN